MKKNVIALLLAVVMVSGNVGTVPALAAEATTQEAVAVEEETVEDAEEESAETEDAGTGEVSEGTTETVTVEETEEVPEQELTEEVDTTEEAEEADTTEVDEVSEETEMSEETEVADEAGTMEEDTAEDTEDEDSAVPADTSAEMTEEEEPDAITEEGTTEVETKEAALSEGDIVDSGTCGENATWTLTGTDTDLTLTISGSGDMDDFSESNIPWASKRAKIKTLIVEDGITSVGDYAFYSLNKLTSVLLADSVTGLGYDCFSDCVSLKSITIPDGVTWIGRGAFCGCSNLTSVTIPDSVTSIGDYAFCGCSGLTSITIPDSVTRIGEYAFEDCNSLKSITIPDSVTSIGYRAFYNGELVIRFRGTEDQWYAAVYSGYCMEYKSIIYNCFSVPASVSLSGTSFTYNRKAIKPAVTVTYKGKKLVEGTDYRLVYKNNVNAGKATVIINGIGKYSGTITKTFTINKAANAITAGNFTKAYSTKAQSFSLGAKATGGTLTYASNSKSVTVTKAGKVTVKAKFIGKAAITITAQNANYNQAIKRITITVNPKKTALSSAKNSASKKMTVKWKKSAAGSGYQIQYSTAKNFKGAKTVTIKKNKIVTKTIGGLKKGKKYYVRVRTYKAVGKLKFYSGWSTVKKVAIKK